jgi:putative transposase
MSKHAYKFRVYPTKNQVHVLTFTLDRCRELYNAAVQERRDAYDVIKRRGDFYDLPARKQAIKEQNISYYSQATQLPDIKQMQEDYQDIHSQVLQDVLRRVDKAFKAFFTRCKNGATAGYPRFQGCTRYDSFTYPQAGFSLTTDHRVCLSKIGSVKIKLHRAMKGTIKTCTIKREGDCWYVVFVCEVEGQPLPLSYEDVGIDLGITHFATCSDGRMIDNPRHYRHAEKKLATLQRKLALKKRGSHRRKKAVQQVAQAHRKIKNQRRDFQHKESRKLVNRYQVIVFEDLAASNLSKVPKPKQDETGTYLPNGAAAKGGLNKSILDAGWAMFQQFCTYKAANAGRQVLLVNPKYTSQVCSKCGTVRKKTLDERWHSCACGCKLDRDHNAAINILRLGRSLQSVSAA